jgi:hypothetical protein
MPGGVRGGNREEPPYSIARLRGEQSDGIDLSGKVAENKQLIAGTPDLAEQVARQRALGGAGKDGIEIAFQGALGDAFYLGGMQGVELVGIACLLGEDPRHPLAGDGKSRLELFIAGDLAADVAVEPTQSSAQFAHPAHGLLVPPAMDRRDTSRRAWRPTRRKDCRSLMPCCLASRLSHSMPRTRR